MFDAFSEKISEIFNKLRSSGALKEEDVDKALREVRIALLEADASLEIVKKFIADVKEKAIGQEVIKSVSPAQMVVKIVHDHLVALFGESQPIEIKKKPYKIMLIGLQGAGKTTTAGKIAKYFSKQNKKVTLASTDIYRPAAISQLRILTKKVNGAIFAQDDDSVESCEHISKMAIASAAENDSDVLIIDTAGRLHIDDIKMEELSAIENIILPDEIILVVDIMTGQEAFNIATKFSEQLKISGVILTRVDGDARGGVALSMRAITGCPIKFLCKGEQLDDIEFFDAERVASRLLGMGDIVALVEKAQENFSQEEAITAAKRLQEGLFTFDDFAMQIERVSKIGGIKTFMKMLPQNKQLEGLMDSHGVSDMTFVRNLAIIRSMTKNEKANSKLLNGSRKKRIATGSGTTVQEVNKLIKQYDNTAEIFKRIKRSGGLGKMMSMLKNKI